MYIRKPPIGSTGPIPPLLVPLVTSKMAEKRVAEARPKTWRLVLKTSNPLSETSKALLPSAPRSPLQLYLSLADNSGAQAWKDMTEEQRRPVVAQFKEAKRMRGQVLAMLRKKAALTAYLAQLDTDLASVLTSTPCKQAKKPRRARAPKPAQSSSPVEKPEVQSKDVPVQLPGAQSPEVVQAKSEAVEDKPEGVEDKPEAEVAAKPVETPVKATSKRVGWRTLKAMRRYGKTLQEGLPEGSTVTSNEVQAAWKVLSYSEKQPFFARKSV